MDATLIIDARRCAGTGVCLPIAAGHLTFTGTVAEPTPGTTLPIAAARSAAACCPQEAITVLEHGPADFQVHQPIVTLGPVGTDADAEAARHCASPWLVDSFAAAMTAAAADPQVLALVAAGYLRLDTEGRAVDSWVDQHFRHHGVLRLLRCWESPTKPMCLAVRDDLTRSPETVATHPATRVFATRHAPAARLVTVDAKPLAAAAAAAGQVDAAIASVDVVARYPHLRVAAQWAPTMVWLLYGQGVSDAP
ncbi:ferredoxin [Nocardia sp. NPDC004068]|uniref:ferredoxin n=1 Tax=Nocardia sp. NPDC004068 TaxID=3364303 RepID=UPI0036916048